MNAVLASELILRVQKYVPTQRTLGLITETQGKQQLLLETPSDRKQPVMSHQQPGQEEPVALSLAPPWRCSQPPPHLRIPGDIVFKLIQMPQPQARRF